MPSLMRAGISFGEGICCCTGDAAAVLVVIFKHFDSRLSLRRYMMIWRGAYGRTYLHALVMSLQCFPILSPLERAKREI